MRCRNHVVGYRLGAVALLFSLAAGCTSGESPDAPARQQRQAQRTPTEPTEPTEPIVLVVMDPLSAELACACVEGFGQRNYRKLAAYLKAGLGRDVAVEFSDDLAETLGVVGKGREVIVVGERSLVAHRAQQAQLKARPVCALSGIDGSTTEAAVFVARADDPAKDLKDIAGRKVFVALAEGDKKHAATISAMRGADLKPPAQPESRPPGTDAALDVLDSPATPPPVAAMPAFVLKLLEGCGSINKGDLKVIGTTTAVPFITVFVSENIPSETQAAIRDRLLSVKSDPQLLKQIESRDGFTPLDLPPEAQSGAAGDWPDWRGAGRDGRVPRLPSQLPETVNVVWKQPAMAGCLAGLSVSDGRLIVAERDFSDEFDYYRCLDADSGEPLWQVAFPAKGQLDYGPSPRATPVINGGKAYLLGAFGGLRCVNLADGSTVWERDLPREFDAELPTWGMCSTPLVVDDLLIVNPGGPEASLVALDCATGRTRWATPGAPAAYSAFICGEFGRRRQIVGYDRDSLGGWDPKTGQRLWRLVPPNSGDFNVPTPVALEGGGGVMVCTENNGARLYRFNDAGRIIAEPAGQYDDLAPDTSTPVLTAGRVFGAHRGIHCLDARRDSLRSIWHSDDDTVGDYASLFADERRVLVVTMGGELILLDATADAAPIVSRLRIFEDDDVEVYSHPALVGTRLYIRGGESVMCIELGTG